MKSLICLFLVVTLLFQGGGMSGKMARLWAEIGADASGLYRELQKSKDGLSGFAGGMAGSLKSLVGFTSAAALGGAAVLKFGQFMSDSVRIAAESETVMTRLNATLIATGRGSEISAGQIDKIAGSLMKISAFDDEAITGAYNTLLKFESVPTEGLEGIVKSAMDMSAALGGDLTSNAELLGRALETGVIPRTLGFSAALKEQFSASVKAGDSGKALTLMMDELNKRYGGQASAQIDTYAGATTRLKVAWDEYKEAIGASMIGPLGASKNALAEMVMAEADYVSATNDATEAMKKQGVAAAGLSQRELAMYIQRTEGSEQANEDAEKAILNTVEAYKLQAQMMGISLDELNNLAIPTRDYSDQLSAMSDYATQYDEKLLEMTDLETQLAKARKAGYSETSSKVTDLKGKIDTLNDSIKRQGDMWMLNMLTQQLAIGGMTEAEKDFLLDYQQDTGLITAESRARSEMYWDEVNAIAAMQSKNIVITTYLRTVRLGSGEGMEPLLGITGGGGGALTRSSNATGGRWKPGNLAIVGDIPGMGWGPQAEVITPRGDILPHDVAQRIKDAGLLQGSKAFSQGSLQEDPGAWTGASIYSVGLSGNDYEPQPGYIQNYYDAPENQRGGGGELFGRGGPSSAAAAASRRAEEAVSKAAGAASAAASGVKSVSEAAMQISSSSAQTTAATKQQTAATLMGNQRLEAALMEIKSLLQRNLTGMPKAMAQAVAKSL